ncbi:hypothetical protein R3X48_24210, partial [Salmonella enterica subsp. enterica serovar Typhimurium]|nr:hypothetical protein [Salmonella enterica subsp. enterica serovar Typhimurium]
ALSGMAQSVGYLLAACGPPLMGRIHDANGDWHIILGLTFIGLRASSAHQAAALSGMAQSVGYLLAACGPPLMGRIHDANGDWHI